MVARVDDERVVGGPGRAERVITWPILSSRKETSRNRRRARARTSPRRRKCVLVAMHLAQMRRTGWSGRSSGARSAAAAASRSDRGGRTPAARTSGKCGQTKETNSAHGFSGGRCAASCEPAYARASRCCGRSADRSSRPGPASPESSAWSAALGGGRRSMPCTSPSPFRTCSGRISLSKPLSSLGGAVVQLADRIAAMAGVVQAMAPARAACRRRRKRCPSSRSGGRSARSRSSRALGTQIGQLQ